RGSIAHHGNIHGRYRGMADDMLARLERAPDDILDACFLVESWNRDQKLHTERSASDAFFAISMQNRSNEAIFRPRQTFNRQVGNGPFRKPSFVQIAKVCRTV